MKPIARQSAPARSLGQRDPRTSRNAQAFGDVAKIIAAPLTVTKGKLTVKPARALVDLAATTITDPTDTPASADALRDNLVATTIADLSAALEAQREAHNDLLARLRSAGFLME
jgi:hypothetical protein